MFFWPFLFLFFPCSGSRSSCSRPTRPHGAFRTNREPLAGPVAFGLPGRPGKRTQASKGSRARTKGKITRTWLSSKIAGTGAPARALSFQAKAGKPSSGPVACRPQKTLPLQAKPPGQAVSRPGLEHGPKPVPPCGKNAPRANAMRTQSVSAGSSKLPCRIP